MSFTPSFPCTREEALEAFDEMLNATREEPELKRQILELVKLPHHQRHEVLLAVVNDMRAHRESPARTCAMWMLSEPGCCEAALAYLRRQDRFGLWLALVLTVAVVTAVLMAKVWTPPLGLGFGRSPVSPW